ncbi:hypothetical protein [Nocardiopsis dassonvillei]|uniref:hypothetical protein n=1 Tax=Nocardiopsis dassonvillei TaxID=2014 RepID=UPI00157DBCB8|nr:hypothetical protein [Nocardiopsis dassonvillei]
MTWQTDPEEGSVWAVQGAKSGARMARLQLQSATRGGQGIVEPTDLEVRATTIPDGTVKVNSGGCVVLGREQGFQGSYYGYNVGLDSVSIAPTGSGGGRSDLIVARVEDPTVEGPNVWSHALTDQLIYTRVIQGVSATETDIPAGSTYSAIPLARVDIPANTATITQDMITDLRQMIDPRTQRELRVMRGGGLEDGRHDEADYKADFERWPQNDWSVDIPAWATQVQVLSQWSNVWYPAPIDGTGGNYDARGQVRVGLIGGSPNNILTPETEYNFNATSASNGYRCSIGLAAQVDIPEAMRGTTVQLRMYAKSDADRIHFLVADGWANFSTDLEFREIPTSAAAP